MLLARELESALGAELIASTTTRLLVDLNRSPGHPRLFSEFSRVLSLDERRRLLAHFYRPYRDTVQSTIAAALTRAERVIHLSIHSFTPVLSGKVRHADLGLLYDPGRRAEREFCAELRAILGAELPHMQIRRNYPYRGTSDGLTTYLRRQFPGNRYLGVELEISQRHSCRRKLEWKPLRRSISKSILATL